MESVRAFKELIELGEGDPRWLLIILIILAIAIILAPMRTFMESREIIDENGDKVTLWSRFPGEKR